MTIKSAFLSISILAGLSGLAFLSSAFAPVQHTASGTPMARGPAPGAPIVGVPSGGIIMWSGTLADIPGGWALCDGSNGTLDLRDQFVRGAAAGSDPGGTGGALNHVHQVSATTDAAGAHSHVTNWGEGSGTWVVTKTFGTTTTSGSTETMMGFDGTYDNGQPPNSYQAFNTSAAPNHSHIVTQASSSQSASLPPYFALAFIVRN